MTFNDIAIIVKIHIEIFKQKRPQFFCLMSKPPSLLLCTVVDLGYEGYDNAYSNFWMIVSTVLLFDELVTLHSS